jgi:hypothetical protein
VTAQKADFASFEWRLLHDAVLLSAAVDWEYGMADLVLNLPSPPHRRITIRARDLSSLSCPREQPWGRSVHVNQVSVTLPEAGQRAQIRIEMQSGDVIEVKADRIEIEVLELPRAQNGVLKQ